MEITWRPQMAIDHGIIDNDHQTIIGIINEFFALKPTVSGKVQLQLTLDKLNSYAKVHFAREEGLQAAALYPKIDEHHEEHMELLRRLAEITRRVAELDVKELSIMPDDDIVLIDCESLSQAEQAYQEIRLLLRDWLVEHIVKSDMEMRPYTLAMAKHTEDMDDLLAADTASWGAAALSATGR